MRAASVSTAGWDSEDSIGLAAVAVWRRRQEACSEAVGPADEEQEVDGYSSARNESTDAPLGEANHTNRLQANGHAAVNGSTDSAGLEFAASQQAALSAMIGFAGLGEQQTPPPRAAGTSAIQTQHVSEVLPRDASAGAASHAAPIIQPSVIDQSGIFTPAGPERVSDTKTQEREAETRAMSRGAAAETEDRVPVPLWTRVLQGPWPLLCVLAVQAVFSLRLAWANTAFPDEALYLWAGRLEWSHVLHGTPIPAFATYFSGAPVIYPLIGAAANAIGGLAGARILSLCFMLGATSLIWTCTCRLYGKRAAFFAAALFASLGPTQYLGSFATFDAMAIFLLALSLWFVIRAGQRQDATRWMIAAAITLAAADATAYSAAIFDPVVIAAAVAVAYPVPGGRLAKSRGAVLLTYVCTILIPLAKLGGHWYERGIAQTTFSRAIGPTPPLVILADAGLWVGVLAIIAAGGAAFALLRRRRDGGSLLPVVLAGAVLIAPLEQARIRTGTSLNKHVDYGALFAAIAAGYLIDLVIRRIRAASWRAAVCGACAAALCVPFAAGRAQSREFFTWWPNETAFLAVLAPYAAGHGRILVDTPAIPEYYLWRGGTSWERWSSTSSITLPDGRSTIAQVGISTSAAKFAPYIRSGYFALIGLRLGGGDSLALDSSLAAMLRADPDYRVIKVMRLSGSHLVLWQYHPPARRGAR
jgi:4-amino-4-deoxy-L-arabinose transferase-like glycosyltransferase